MRGPSRRIERTKEIGMRARVRRENDVFLALVRKFPLRRIRDERTHAEAVAVLIRLDGKPRQTAEERDYANTLAVLIKQFEKPIVLAKTTVAHRLRFLMNESGMNITRLGEIIGSQPEASMVLA